MDAPSTLQSFSSNQEQDAINHYGQDQNLAPPDDNLAVGMSSLIEATNSRLIGYDRSEPTPTKIFDVDINAFIHIKSGYTATDPRIEYDSQSERFFFSVMEYDPAGCGSDVVVLVSPSNGNLTSTWTGVTLADLTAGTNATFSGPTTGDQPSLGLSNNLVMLNWNQYLCSNNTVGNGVGDQIDVLQKSDLLGNTITSKTDFAASTNQDFGMQPVLGIGSDPTGYIVENASPFTSPSYAFVYTVTGTPEASNVSISPTLEPITETPYAPPAPQNGTTLTLDTGDYHFLNAVWQNGAIWTGATTQCTPTSDSTARSCLDYVEFTTSGTSITGVHQIPFIGISGEYLYYPAVSIDAAGNVFSVFTESSAAQYPLIEVASIDSSAGGTTLGSFSTLQTSATYYDPGFYGSGSTARWGDYHGAAQDPAHPTDVWVVGEDVENTTCTAPGSSDVNACWDTHIGRYTLSAPTVTGVAPAAGPVGGGQTVTISGSDFLSGSTVTIGGAPAAVDSLTPDAMTVTTPSHTAGLVYVQVTSSLGASPATAPAAGYIYTGLGTYVPITPFRVYDSRPGTCVNCGSPSPLGGGASRTVTIASASSGYLRTTDNATAVVLNVTVVNATARSYLSVWPNGTARPVASNLNFNPGITIANLVTVTLGQSSTSDANREVTLYNNTGSVDVIIDIEGYFTAPVGGSPSGTFHAIPPLRICDSRGATGAIPATVCNHGSTTSRPLGTASVEKVWVAGAPGAAPSSSTDPTTQVPSDGTAEGVVLNITAVLPQPATYMSVFPTDSNGNCSSRTPAFSNVNLPAGGVAPNRVMAELGPDSPTSPNPTDICVWNYHGPANFIIDLNGWYGSGGESPLGAEFQPIGPTRVCDSRAGTGTACSGAGSLAGGVSRAVTINMTSNTEAAVIANVTAVLPSVNTFITVYPADASLPNASDLNPRAGLTVPNLDVVKVSGSDQVDIYNNAGAVDYIFDVGGWFQ